MRTLEKYFKDNLKNKVIDFTIRSAESLNKEDGIIFHIYPTNTSGDTIGFKVSNNELTTVFDTKK